MVSGVLVTGAAGFICSNFCEYWISNHRSDVIAVDKMGYASSRDNLKDLEGSSRFHFYEQDINNKEEMIKILKKHRPAYVVHGAANSHVDNSIADRMPFIIDNVQGTVSLLDAVMEYYKSLSYHEQKVFIFHYMNTDEIFGSLSEHDLPFTEKHPLKPNNPYAASKASAGLLVRSYAVTFGLPILITNCSNNYGPKQHEEKLIPKVIKSCIEGSTIPIYGKGQNVRDWLHVSKHCEAIMSLLLSNTRGGIDDAGFNIGGDNEVKNIDIVNMICEILDDIYPKKTGSYMSQIKFVTDRLGHDLRYSINASKIRGHGWEPFFSFRKGLRDTVVWYLKNRFNIEVS